MSCHTWAYCRIKPQKEKEIREYLQNILNNMWSIVPDGMNEDEYINLKYNEMHDIYVDITRDDIAKMVHKDNIKYRQYRTEIKTCDFKKLSEILEDIGYPNYKAHNGCIYENCAFDKPVRIYGYPKEVFTDADEFIKWIKESEAKNGYAICEYYNWEDEKYVQGFDDTAERLIRKFWEK